MPLLGSAAMLLTFNVNAQAISEHDDWHTHEHLPERLSIPGFIRGTRWVALRSQPRYMVIYEVAQLVTLTSEAYLERLNNPTEWTTRMMPHYRGMSRGFCRVVGSFGLGTGALASLIRFKPAIEAVPSLRAWLLEASLPQLPSRAGIGSVHFLEGTGTPPATNEQRMRGIDAGVDWAILLTGYREDALLNVSRGDLAGSDLTQRGATDVLDVLYQIDYSLSRYELAV